MKRRRIRTGKYEEGIALLISIFVLLLISVVAIALIVSSGTESALAGNYRSSTGVYNAAIAGLEEVRARLRPNSPISFKNTDPAFLPAGGASLLPCAPVYVINPLGGENVTPWVSGSTYADTEFSQEFTGICPAGSLPPNPSPRAFSIWNTNPLNGLPFPGPLYKWVRINGVTEQSLKLDVVPYDGTANDATPIYYDGTFNNNSSGHQVLELTALAVLPDGSQKLVQYLVAPLPITLPQPVYLAALTLSGSNGGSDPVFQAPANNNAYAVKGSNDQDCNGNPWPSKVAIGIYGNYPGASSNTAITSVISGIPGPPTSPPKTNYTGSGASLPDVEYLNASPPQTPTELNNMVQTIIQSADAVVPAGSAATQTAYLNSLNMSPSNMLTVVANGDLDLTHWGSTGYGLLLVTGTYTMDPDNGWYGVILVIGEGKIINVDNTGSREFDGAVFVAKTNGGGSNLGAADVRFNDDMQGNGIRYSSCWIQRAQPTSGYKILSFHEIAQ